MACSQVTWSVTPDRQCQQPSGVCLKCRTSGHTPDLPSRHLHGNRLPFLSASILRSSASESERGSGEAQTPGPHLRPEVVRLWGMGPGTWPCSRLSSRCSCTRAFENHWPIPQANNMSWEPHKNASSWALPWIYGIWTAGGRAGDAAGGRWPDPVTGALREDSIRP